MSRRQLSRDVCERNLFQSRAGFSECLDFVSFAPTSSPSWFQSRAGFSECLDDDRLVAPIDETGFNPVLGFLSVSTSTEPRFAYRPCLFQSRAGFSECLDFFWLVTTHPVAAFQSRAGFSECLDRKFSITATSTQMFQSRAGFSECLDPIPSSQPATKCSFNPVLGFLSVSTGQLGDRWDGHRGVSIPCWVF